MWLYNNYQNLSGI